MGHCRPVSDSPGQSVIRPSTLKTARIHSLLGIQLDANSSWSKKRNLIYTYIAICGDSEKRERHIIVLKRMRVYPSVSRSWLNDKCVRVFMSVSVCLLRVTKHNVKHSLMHRCCLISGKLPIQIYTRWLVIYIYIYIKFDTRKTNWIRMV